jgi:hypothetical protein
MKYKYSQQSLTIATITLVPYKIHDAGPEDAPEFGRGIYWLYVYDSTMSNKDKHQYKDKTNKDIRGNDTFTIEGIMAQGIEKHPYIYAL